MKIPKGPGRNPFKRDQIVNFVKNNIINGTWQPGERVPPRTFLEKKFAASSVTVQQSLDVLNKDGFVRVKGKLGTFVNEKLPHENNYGLVFPDKISKKEPRNAYFEIFDNEAKKLQKQFKGKFIRYYDINEKRDKEFFKLVQDIQERRLAGVIFTTNPYMVDKTPIVDLPGIPRVAFGSKRGTDKLHIINMGGGEFMGMAVDYLVAQGKKKIALIESSVGPKHSEYQKFLKLLGKKGISYPEWHQTASLNHPETAGQIVKLLMSKFNTERPEGLIITNDNHTPHIQKALVEIGIKVPEELTLVSLTNFPSQIPQKPPVKLIGYDILGALQKSVQIINDLRDGKKAQLNTKISAEFGN